MENTNKLKKIRDEIFSVIETVLISMFIMTLLFTYFLRPTTVDGKSMVPTLNSEDKLFISAINFGYKQGDIIVIDCQQAVMFDDEGSLEYRKGLEKTIVKRVVATGGQKIDIDFDLGLVYVDDVLLEESYINDLTHLDSGAFTGEYPIIVPEGYLFVMGDNRNNSRDSRDIEVGLVDEDTVLGKAIFRLAPFDSMGFID